VLRQGQQISIARLYTD